MRRTQFTSSVLQIGLTLAGLTIARADFNPVPLTPGSFTQDIIVENTAPPPLQAFANTTMENGTNATGNTFFEAGFLANLPWLGLPAHGTTFISHSETNHVWLMPPSYVTNNVAYIGSANIPGTSPGLLQTQVVSAALSVLPASQVPNANGLSVLWAFNGTVGPVAVTIYYADGSAQPLTITPIDWLNTTSPFEYIASGRIQEDAGNAPVNTVGSTTTVKLFRTDLGLNDPGSTVTNVAFSIGAAGSTYRFMAFGLSETTDNLHYNPVQVSGFNYDAVVETNASFKNPNIGNYTVTMDQGVQGSGNTFYEQGFCAEQSFGQNSLNSGGLSTTNGVTAVTSGAPFSGLPHPGTTLTSGNFSFKMPADYSVNHCLFIGAYSTNFAAVTNLGLYCSPTYWPVAPNYTTGALQVLAPQPYKGFAVLASAGNGPCVINYTIAYDNGNTDSGQISVFNWFQADATLMWNAAGRVTVGGGPSIQNLNGSPAAALYRNNLTVTAGNQGASATNISFGYVSGGRAPIFDLAASSDGTTYSHIGFSGFNAKIIVAKEQPAYPAGLFAYTSATMDNGTNNFANTWSEQGWCTNGVGALTTYLNPLTHVTNQIAAGFPIHGTTLASISDPAKHYQLPASYTQANAVLLDINHGVNNITPVTPGIYSAFALLNAGASIGAANTMTNKCIIQHADGTAETNNFFGFDWFKNTAVPAGVTASVAYIANGRAENRGGSETSLAGGTNGFAGVNQDPRLFETFFVLTNLTSAVTNILITTNVVPGAANWATYVLAVSATKDTFLNNPVANSPTVNQDNDYTRFEGQSISIWTGTGGIPPSGVQWQYSPDFGFTWVNLNNGGLVSGATTTNLTFSSLGWTNSGMYRMYGCNVNGCVTNAPATVRVYSTLPDITEPSDPITVFQPNGGSSANTEQAGEAIVDLVGVDPGGTPKYLNFGGNGGAPFLGPIGMVISPQLGKTTVSALRVYTANDNPQRDPADYGLEGSNDGGSTWTPIAGGPITLTQARNANNPSVPPYALTQAVAEVHFTNPNGYTTYRLSFTNAANNSLANSMQMAEIELLGIISLGCPTLLQDVVPTVHVVGGASPNFSIRASANPAPTFQWQRNNGAGFNNVGANSPSYTLANAQTSDSGAQFRCIVDNGCGTPLVSSIATLTVSAAPTAAYPTNVLNDTPVAFLRLGEGPDDNTGGGNNGLTAYDSWGGHNGFYTNAILQPNSPGSFADPSDGDALFGQSAGAGINNTGNPDSGVEGIPGIDFSKPAGQNGAFSVEAWVRGDPSIQPAGVIAGAGVISKGYGNGGEQFALEAGGPAVLPFVHTFRFFVRNAGSETPAIQSTGVIGPDPGVWHHLVGVCDQANSSVLLYIDGVPQNAGTIAPGAGILDTPDAVVIGARSGSSTTNNNLTFAGTIDDAALYNYPLSQAQVLKHYYATTNLPPMVQAGNDLPPTTTLYAGRGVVLTAKFVGTPPLSYQWFKNGNPILGATTNTYVVPNAGTNDPGTYYLQACNNYNGGTCANSGSAVVTVETVVDFNTAVGSSPGVGLGWQLQFGDALAAGSRGFDTTTPDAIVTLTDGTGSESAATFYQSPLYIGAFQASYTYQDVGGGGADGMSFCIQNDPRHAAAVGGGGGLLGYSGITNSFALLFDIYANNGPTGAGGPGGYRFVLNNASPAGGTGAYLQSGGVNQNSGDPINVSLFYNGTTLFLTMTDAVASASFSTSTNVNIPALVGNTNTAYVGFTGADGGVASTQTIANFSFVPLPTLSVVNNLNGTFTLSWPASIGGYVLLEATGLQPANWVVSGATVGIVGNNNSTTITPLGGAKFYKLGLNLTSPQ